MKAIVYYQYGPPEVLKVEEIDLPTPKENEVLVKIYSASVNSWDWDMITGKPLIVRLWGLFKPKYHIPGADIAGRVEAVGQNIKRLKPGDEVFGDLCEYGWGGFAEYVCAPEKALALKPAGMTFEQAAAIPQAGAMAIQSLRDIRSIKQGEKILINGAGGGVGTFAVQLAKSFGAEVTAVDSAEKLDMLRGLGADHTINYMQEDYTKNGESYDLIIDVVASRSLFAYQRSLNPGGTFIMIGGTMSTIFRMMLLGPLISKTGRKKLSMLAYRPNKDLDFLNKLFEAGKMMPVIDRRYPLSEAAKALRHLGEGKVRGKVIVTMT